MGTEMLSKKQAEIISDSLIEAERSEGKRSNFKRLNFIYGYILGEDIIEQYSDSPKRIRQAIKRAQSSWHVVFIFAILLVISIFFFMYLKEPLNLVIGIMVILGGAGLGKTIIRSKAIRYLDENTEIT